MVDCSQDVITRIKDGFYAAYFADIPEELITKAIEWIECNCPEYRLLASSRCKNSFIPWLTYAVMALIQTNIKKVVDGQIEINDLDKNPNLFLKKRKILNVECEWAEIKGCNACPGSIKQQITSKANDYVKACEDLYEVFSFGYQADCESTCKPCDEKTIR